MTLASTKNVSPVLIPPPTAPGRSEAEGPSRKRAGWRLIVFGAVGGIVLGGVLAVGLVSRLQQQKQLDAATVQRAGQPPPVTVAVARRVAPTAERILPGNSLP